MNHLITILFIWALSVGAANGIAVEADSPPSDEMLARQVTAAMNQQPAPLLAAKHQLNLARAYRLQTLAVKQQLGAQPLLGFKAGLTSKAAQQKFGVEQPVAGVLLGTLPEPMSDGRYSVNSARFIRPMLEVEIGFRLNRVISQQVTDIALLKTWVKEILPVVEFPDLSFEQPGAATGLDIVANNVLAKAVIAGRAIPLASLEASLDINALVVNVDKNDQPILTGKGADVVGDQWLALQWLINQTLANGWEVGPEHILITGAMGKMLAAGPGHYQVNYGPLGVINFTMEAVELP